MTHNISLGSLVEINCDYLPEHRTRQYVVGYEKDCDGTPLYKLSTNKEWVDESELFPLDDGPSWYAKGLNKGESSNGWPEGCLIVIDNV